MKLRIRTSSVDLSPSRRAALEGHFRIALGNRSSRFRAATIAFSMRPESHPLILCRITLQDAEGGSERIEETARDVETAMDWAIWRLIHSLERRALRAFR